MPEQINRELLEIAKLFVEFTPAAVFPNDDPYEELDKARKVIERAEAEIG
jgi:hypothetical protein